MAMTYDIIYVYNILVSASAPQPHQWVISFPSGRSSVPRLGFDFVKNLFKPNDDGVYKVWSVFECRTPPLLVSQGNRNFSEIPIMRRYCGIARARNNKRVFEYNPLLYCIILLLLLFGVT